MYKMETRDDLLDALRAYRDLVRKRGGPAQAVEEVLNDLTPEERKAVAEVKERQRVKAPELPKEH